MLKKKLILSFIVVLLSIMSLALAQEQEMKDYKVQQGDTLWDISNKELNDSFLWPKVWKENPEIANPDKIMPGQTIKIPLYLIHKNVQKEEPVAEPIVDVEPRKAAPVPTVESAPARIKPLVDANLYVSSGYIADTVNELGMIVGSPLKKNIFGTSNYIYVNTKEPAKVGDKYSIVRKKKIIHPVNKSVVGDMVQMLGVAEVEIIKQGEVVAKILKSYEEAILGDLLIAYADMPPPVVSKPYRKPNIEAYVVAARNMTINNGMFDIIYLDKGKNAGLAVGDLLRAISIEKQLEGFTLVEHRYPHGVVQILKVYDHTSVAIIRQSVDSIEPGHLVIHYD